MVFENLKTNLTLSDRMILSYSKIDDGDDDDVDDVNEESPCKYGMQ